jgi:hypothetical protein
MMKNILVRFGLLACAILIVLPVNTSVKHLSSNRITSASVAILTGSPLPFPNPPGRDVLALTGSPLPFPTPPGSSVLTTTGSPLPFPNPPGRLA